MNLSTQLTSAAQIVEEARRRSPTRKEDLEVWYESCPAVHRELLERAPDVPLPLMFSHFLSDADIRIKDQQYAEGQLAEIDDLIAELRSGQIPVETSVRLPALPFIILLIGLIAALTGGIWWLVAA